MFLFRLFLVVEYVYHFDFIVRFLPIEPPAFLAKNTFLMQTIYLLVA